jgi:hypothetical protein
MTNAELVIFTLDCQNVARAQDIEGCRLLARRMPRKTDPLYIFARAALVCAQPSDPRVYYPVGFPRYLRK